MERQIIKDKYLQSSSQFSEGVPGDIAVKNPPALKKAACNAEDTVSLPGSGRSPGKGNGNPLQYSCLGNPRTEEPVGLWTLGSQELDTTL